MAEVNEFNLSYLQKKINELKEETNESSEYTIEYLQCLMEDHDLQDSLDEVIEIKEIPDIILNKLRQGDIPSEDDLLSIDAFMQFVLRSELIFACGMHRLKLLGGEELKEGCEYPMCEVVTRLTEMSPACCGGAYIFMAMLLLTSVIPSPIIIGAMTSNFGESQEEVETSSLVFQELSDNLLDRYRHEKKKN